MDTIGFDVLANNKLAIDYKAILDTIDEGIYAIDREGICIYANASCCQILKFNNAGELIGQDIHQLIHYAFPDGSPYPARQCKIYQAILGGKEIKADDEFFWTADGQALAVAYHVYPFYKDGQRHGAVVSFTDISQLKENQNRLNLSEIKYRSIFENANAGIFYLNDTGEIESANQAFFEMMQYSFKELREKKINEIILPEDWEKEVSYIHEMREGKRDQYRMEKRYIRKDGKLVWGNTSVSAYRTLPSAPLSYIAIVKDITGKKEYERQIIESKATKDKFYSIIAHDLRNPIGAIKLLSGFIKEEIEANNLEEVKNLVNLLNSQVDQTHDLLNDLLQWSRTQTERISFHPENQNLRALISDYIDSHQVLAANKKVKLEYSIAPQIMAFADENMLNTIIRNLLTNAIKFSFEHSQITISAEERPQDILIRVKDEGKGIPPAVLEKLFRIDAKITTPGTHNEKGTGLGLLLCKEFIQLHGGSIWVESEVNAGTCFFFTLPKKNR